MSADGLASLLGAERGFLVEVLVMFCSGGGGGQVALHGCGRRATGMSLGTVSCGGLDIREAVPWSVLAGGRMDDSGQP